VIFQALRCAPGSQQARFAVIAANTPLAVAQLPNGNTGLGAFFRSATNRRMILLNAGVGLRCSRYLSSTRVMKDDPDRATHACADATDAVPEVDPVSSLCALNRPVMDSENNRIALA
jgi:hypothetical protein